MFTRATTDNLKAADNTLLHLEKYRCELTEISASNTHCGTEQQRNR
jgi:hypothetical protein